MTTVKVRYRLYWIRLVDDRGNFVHFEEFHKRYENQADCLRFINDYTKEQESFFRMKLKNQPWFRQVPRKEYISDIVGGVCMYLDLSRESVLSKLQDRTLADARKIIVDLCLDLDLTPSQIEEKTGIKRTTVYSAKTALNKLTSTDKEFRELYKAIRNKVIPQYSEDGSGTKIETT